MAKSMRMTVEPQENIKRENQTLSKTFSAASPKHILNFSLLPPPSHVLLNVIFI